MGDASDQHLAGHAIQSAPSTLTQLKEHRCPHLTLTDSNRSKWAALSTATSVLTALGADHNICCGTLLGWYRSCTLFDTDIDLEVSLAWWRQPGKSDILRSSLLAAGAYQGTSGLSFGLWLQPGYEEAWFFDGVKIDFFARSKVNVSLRHWPRNLPAKGPFYATGLTIRTNRTIRTNALTTFACISPLAPYVREFWSTVPIFVPEPVEPTLVAAYGKHWQTPRQSSAYEWNVTPFFSGWCAKEMILCPHQYYHRGVWQKKNTSTTCIQNAKWKSRSIMRS